MCCLDELVCVSYFAKFLFDLDEIWCAVWMNLSDEADCHFSCPIDTQGVVVVVLFTSQQ